MTLNLLVKLKYLNGQTPFIGKISLKGKISKIVNLLFLEAKLFYNQQVLLVGQMIDIKNVQQTPDWRLFGAFPQSAC